MASGEERLEEAIGRCSNTLTKTALWKHSEDPFIAALMKAIFTCMTIENYGITNNQTNATEAFANLNSRWLFETYSRFALNGVKGLAELPIPDRDKYGFFMSHDQFEQVLVEVLPEQMHGHWAGSDREGTPYKRYDSLAILYGISQLAVPDFKFYYLGCPYQGMNAQQWACLADAYWPPNLAPSTTIADLLATALAEITLQNYNVDNRGLVGIIGLGAFTGITLSIKDAIVAPFPTTVTQNPWLCFVWFGLQQSIVAFLNSSVCRMNYRFSQTYLLGCALWCALRWISEMYNCLQIDSGGTIPIMLPTLAAACSRLANLVCSIYRENNRGGFKFKDCEISSPLSGLQYDGVTYSEPTPCRRVCGPIGCEPGTNASTMSNLGDGTCQCPKCCIEDCPPPCPPPCPPAPCSEPCSTTEAASCIPSIHVLVGAFIQYAYVTTGSTSSSLSSSSFSSSSNFSGSSAPSLTSAGPDFQNSFALSGGSGPSTLTGGGGRGISGSSGIQLGGSASGTRNYSQANFTLKLKDIFTQIAKVTGKSKSSQLLAALYYAGFDAVQATSLAHNYFSLNPSAFIESLMAIQEIVFRYTLGRESNFIIPLNSSPQRIPKTAFNALLSELSFPQMQAMFISCTVDVQSGFRFDYCTMIESQIRISQTDSWAYYRGKRLDGFTPCEWSRLHTCYWSIDPNITLAGILASPILGLFLRVYPADNRSFTGIPGLEAFDTVTLTLRQVLGTASPVPDNYYLTFIWEYIIKGSLAGFLNATLNCIGYRFGRLAYLGMPLFVLRAFSDMVWALNSSAPPEPPTDSMYLLASIGRMLEYPLTIANENARGVKNLKDFKWDTSSICTQRTGCSCGREYLTVPEPGPLASSFITYMTQPSQVSA